MNKSARVFVTFSVAALIVIACISFLTYQAWVWQPPLDTLAHGMRPVALVFFPLAGLSLVIRILADPLAWRVVRMLRRRERLASGSVG